MSEKFDSDFLKLMIEKIMERYGLCALISEFCDTVEVIECGDHVPHWRSLSMLLALSRERETT